MKDIDIIKALEEYEVICDDCACNDGFITGKKIMLKALDLINHQQAEIEELKVENKKLNLIVEEINDYINPLPFKTDFDNAIEDAKSEAYEEFAKKLKCGVPQETGVIHCVDVDNLVKEMKRKGE